MKRHIIWLTILAWFAVVLLHAQTMLPSYHLRLLTTEDGLLSNNVHEVVQDDGSYLWMATANGLCRFDGYQFEAASGFATGSSPSSLHIGRMAYDQQNQLLWVCTSYYEVACYDLRRGQYIDYTGRGDTKREYAKMRPSRQALWLFNTEGTVRRVSCHGGQFTTTDYTLDTHINQLVEDSTGRAWAATAKGLTTIGTDGKQHTIAASAEYTDVVAYNRGVVGVAADGNIELFNDKAQRQCTIQRPKSMGNMGRLLTTVLSGDCLFLFTDGDTYEVNLQTGRYMRPADCQVSGGKTQQTCGAYTLVANRSGSAWLIGPKGRPQRLDLFSRYHSTDRKNRLFTLAQDSRGMLYIATYGNGLFVYDPAEQRITAHYSRTDKSPLVSSDYLQQVYVDRMDNVWVCSSNQGVSCINFPRNVSYKLIELPQSQDEWASSVIRLNYADGQLLTTTRDGRVLAISPTDNNRITDVTSNYGGIVSCMLTDRHGRQWTGTLGQGLYIDGQHYTTDNHDRIIPSDAITQMAEDEKGRVWIATRSNGLLMAETAADGSVSFTQMLCRERNEMTQQDLCIDPATSWLYVATSNGLYRADTKKELISDADFRNYNAQQGRLSANDLRCVLCDDGGRLWVGTDTRGVSICTFDADGNLQDEQRIDKNNGLGSNTVKAIMMQAGYVWVSTTSWITRINLTTEGKTRFEFGRYRLPVAYSENSVLLLPDGRLAFGTNNGLLLIAQQANPKETEGNGSRRMPDVPVSITSISVNGLSVGGNADFADQQLCLQQGSITLSHTQNSLRLSFSNFRYATIKASQYQYLLEGYDRDWLPTTSLSHATYADLPPGHYTFRVRSLVGKGLWQEARPLSIVILQPWWNRWWAWLLYIIVTGALAVTIGRQLRQSFRLRQQMKMEKQMNDFRLTFFTNVAHEFRTPLAIIQGAVSRIADTASPSTARAALQTAQRGTDRLLRLVNHLLEFRRLTTGTLRLHVSESDMVAFVRNIYQDLWSMANQKGITIQLITSERQHVMAFDHEKVETMVYNLLSNAVKYTPQGGNIIVRLRFAEGRFTISVQDSGPGLSAEAQAHLFQPFMNGLASQGGMGIGLYSAREMARLHHGDISYQPADGGGSCFTLTLPDADNIYRPDETADMTEQTARSDSDELHSEAIIREMMPQALNKGVRVVIIEDDPDMMVQIKSELGNYFSVEGYMNGQQGCEAVLNDRPQLLVCDVMLPDMDGYEIVRQVKGRADMRTLPVIMLTALGDERHQLKAYRAGADDFMVKPCNWRLLVARAMQLIKWAATTSERTATTPGTSPAGTDKEKGQGETVFTSHADKAFKERVDALIGAHMTDEQFGIDMLTEMMEMGHTKFYGRMREVTGMTPNRYVMDFRMRRAAELLLKGRLNVGEVAWKVGIQDQSYFNKCFKAQYGVSPSKYGK